MCNVVALTVNRLIISPTSLDTRRVVYRRLHPPHHPPTDPCRFPAVLYSQTNSQHPTWVKTVQQTIFPFQQHSEILLRQADQRHGMPVPRVIKSRFQRFSCVTATSETHATRSNGRFTKKAKPPLFHRTANALTTRCFREEENTLPIFRPTTYLPPRRCFSAFWFLHSLTVVAAAHHRVSAHPLLATAHPVLCPFGGDVFVQCRANRRRFRVSNILSVSFCCRSCITFCRWCTRGETFHDPC